jgi:hypothetical protein
MIPIMAVEFFGDAREPGVEHRRLALALARIQRREAANDACLALRDDEIRGGDYEHRRANNGEAQIMQDWWQAHAGGVLKFNCAKFKVKPARCHRQSFWNGFTIPEK